MVLQEIINLKIFPLEVAEYLIYNRGMTDKSHIGVKEPCQKKKKRRKKEEELFNTGSTF